jgi:hypothetical protein
VQDLLSERHGCRQPARFDAVKIDQARDAMDFRPLHDKIDGRFFGSTGLRPDPGVTGLQSAIPQLGQRERIAEQNTSARVGLTV